MKNIQRGVVISNCQSYHIAAWLSVFSSSTIFDYWEVHSLPPDKRADSIEKFVVEARDKYDIIIISPLSGAFHDLAADKVRTTFSGRHVILVSNIFFSGLHPDLTYLGDLAGRVIGPLGDYHSKLALFSFLSNRTVAEATKLFTGDIYNKLSYFSEFDISMNELQRRDIEVDVGVTDLLPNILHSNYCFYTVNHPTSAVFAPYCSQIIRFMESLGVEQHSGLPIDPLVCEASLAQNTIFPIYPEIAEYHRIPQFGSLAFKAAGARKNPINLGQFIASEYDVFRTISIESLASLPITKKVMLGFCEAL
jgi:hypothetical protein